MSAPTWLPPDGTHWELQRNVLVYDGSGQAPSNISSVAAAETTYTFGTNYGHPDQTDPDGYSLVNLYFLRVDVYENGGQVATMGPDFAPTWQPPNNPAASGYVKVDGGDITHVRDPSVGSGVAWPRIFSVIYTTTMTVPGGITVAVWPYALYGDVWVALPGVDSYETLTGGPPTETPLDPCPPDCGQNVVSGPGGPPPDPDNPTPPGAGLPPGTAEGLSVRWGRTESRIDWGVGLGAVGGLTWDVEWDGERLMLLDGLHLTVTVLGGGGVTQQAEYRWATPPGVTAAGTAAWFILDTTPLDTPGQGLR